MRREEVDDDLLVRGAEHELALAAVRDLHQRGAVLGLAARLLPELGRLERRHQQLLAVGAVDLLADDLLDLAQDAQAQRQEAVDAGRGLLHEAGAQKQAVRIGVGVGGGFAQGFAE